jgi:hypothetical protein
MRLLRLFLRIVLPAGLTTACVVWMLSQWVFVVVRIPLPTGNLHLRADHEGWVLQLANTQSTTHPVLEFHRRQRTTGGWRDWMQDLNPNWLGSGCVYADWQNSTFAVTSRFHLFGVKHYVVVLMSAAAVCMLIQCESHQKRKAISADSVVEIES